MESSFGAGPFSSQFPSGSFGNMNNDFSTARPVGLTTPSPAPLSANTPQGMNFLKEIGLPPLQSQPQLPHPHPQQQPEHPSLQKQQFPQQPMQHPLPQQIQQQKQ